MTECKDLKCGTKQFSHAPCRISSKFAPEAWFFRILHFYGIKIPVFELFHLCVLEFFHCLRASLGQFNLFQPLSGLVFPARVFIKVFKPHYF